MNYQYQSPLILKPTFLNYPFLGRPSNELSSVVTTTKQLSRIECITSLLRMHNITFFISSTRHVKFVLICISAVSHNEQCVSYRPTERMGETGGGLIINGKTLVFSPVTSNYNGHCGLSTQVNDFGYLSIKHLHVRRMQAFH